MCFSEGLNRLSKLGFEEGFSPGMGRREVGTGREVGTRQTDMAKFDVAISAGK